MRTVVRDENVQRDNDFRKALMRFINTQDVFIVRLSAVRITDMVCNIGGPRFYISEPTARRVIYRMKRGLAAMPCSADEHKQRMFTDLFKIYSSLRLKNDMLPEYKRKTESELIRDAMYSETPYFYIPKQRAIDILNDLRK